jgi:type IV pilus assembly protein PilW
MNQLFVANQLTNERGFSLMELLVAVGLGMVILGSVASTFITQTRVYNAQEQVNEMQQSARAAMDLISREIKLAGYKPTGTSITGVSYSTTSLRIRADLNGDGVIDDNSDEHLIFALNSGTSQVTRTYGATGATPQVISNNVSAFTFNYLDSSGVATTTEADIRQLSLSITARTAKPDPSYPTNGGYRTFTLSTTITPPNLAYN